ncbi:MAG: S8 family serine peptidase [Ferruginibacter sp.]
MKKNYFFLLLTFISLNLAAQNERPARFTNGEFVTGNNISRQTFKQNDLRTALYGENYFVLIQFSILPGAIQQQQLKTAGITLAQYLPGNAYLAIINKTFNFSIARNYQIGSINIIPAYLKIDKIIADNNSFDDKKNESYFAVTLFPGTDKKIAEAALLQLHAQVVHTKFTDAPVIFIEKNKNIIDSIAALSFVSYINLQHIKDQTLNHNDVGTHSITALQSPSGRNLDGRNVAVGIGDNAEISTHIDFTGRLINRVFYYPDYHGTHTSGTLAGGGIIDPRYHGMAPKAPIISQWFSDILTNTPAYVTDYNMVATNNSYHSEALGCSGSTVYDVLSNYVDAQALNLKQVLHVIAAGNDGTFACSPYPASFATVKSGWQCAKNVITVGNLVGQDYSISFSSSKGPVQDGRIKPEIVANGTNTWSTFPDNTYGLFGGTSMAAPVVTGTVSLLQQRYRQLHSGTNGSSALMKAVLCNGADDLGNAGPDYTFGFGMLNARRAVEAIETNRYTLSTVSNGGNNTQNISVPAGARRLKVMLCWTDKEAAANAAISLVNDLDLTVTEPSSALHRPLVLNSDPAHVTDTAIERRDSLNNIEQVVIDNPAAGTYTLNINGHAVPFGPQDYVTTYQIDMPSVTVEYPFGGETMVPGETENLRWSAFGNETNDYTVEYSANGGANWLTKDTVAAGSRTFAWTVPATATNNGLIRVSRLGTALSGSSTYPFIILGQPVVTATIPCVGYATLSWPSITSATSYDICQLKGDSMKVIGNTTGTSFLVSGLDKYKTEWLAVIAKNGTVSGRRSIAQSVIANTGTCSLSTFQNDLAIDTILTPTTTRFGTVSNTTTVRISNRGSVAVSGPYTVQFSTGGAASTPETINVSIPPASSLDYTLTNSFSISPGSGIYNLKFWVNNAADLYHENDTAYKVFQTFANDPVTLPYTENFESFPNRELTSGELGFGDIHFDFAPSTDRGRLRTFVNSGFAHSGNRAITLDQRPINGSTNADSLILSLNGSLFGAQSRLEFYYKNHGEDNFPGNKVWMRASNTDPWTEAYDLYANEAGINQWKFAKININDVLSPATPSSTFQIKFGQEGFTSANSVVQEQDYDDGYTFDDISILPAQNDVALVEVVSPGKAGCGLTATTPVTIAIKNYANAAVSNVEVNYRINSGTVVTETIPSIAANTSIQYTFTATADISAYTDYNCDFWLSAPADTYKGNDSMLNYTFHNSPVISSFPYLQGFESNDGGWYAKGNNNSWQYGSPAKTIINKAANGTKAWVTNLTGNYNNNELSYLYSPCFDISSLSHPVLSFSHIYQVETDYDYNWVEYSTDGGLTWLKLGAVGDGTNWYDDVTTQRFRASRTTWHVASVDIPTVSGSVRFRFVMFGDGGLTYEGVGIDDIHIFNKQSIYTGNPISSGLSQTVNSNAWINFNDVNGKRIASVNSFGQNLGVTNVQVYPYSGPQRTSNNQYYADRNIVIQPTNQPASNVGVRFYFTDAEAKNLIAAAGCPSCITVNDPYELGSTQYHGSIAEENGLLDDDQPDSFRFILPAGTDIIPYDNGYYAEFTVNSFSEFWLSKGILGAGSNCAGSTVSYTAAAGGTTYQWQEDTGSGFTNISNGTNYSGAATAVLQLIALPTSASGNKYRCLVNGIADTPRTLLFKMTWNGSTDTNWFNPANWSCGILPDQYTDVVIPGTLVNYPVLNANAAVRSVQLQSGVSITVSTGVVLDIKGR